MMVYIDIQELHLDPDMSLGEVATYIRDLNRRCDGRAYWYDGDRQAFVSAVVRR